MTQSKPIATYAETQGEAPFDWGAALADPPTLDSDEHCKLCRLAGSWVTCACGNQCAVLPRYTSNGMPVDDVLGRLGGGFYDCIFDANWTGAQFVLHKIEARSAELIAEMVEA